MKPNKRLLAIAWTALTVITLLSCSEAPVQPPPPAAQGYPVYFYDNSDNPKWYVYYPDTDNLDSADIPMNDPYNYPYDAELSPNGDRMYVSHGTGGGMVAIDLLANEVIKEFEEYTGKLSVSPNGEYLAINWQGIHIIKTSDLSVAYNYPNTPMSDPVFDSDNRTLWGVVLDNITRTDRVASGTIDDLANINLQEFNWEGLVVSRLQVIPGHYDDQLLILGPSGNDFVNTYFDWSPTQDTIRLANPISTYKYSPKTVASSDGRYVACTTTGSSWLDPKDRPCSIILFDAAQHTLIDSVNTRIEVSPGDTVHFDALELAFTPDNKYLLGISNSLYENFNQVLVYDIQTRAIVRFREIPGTHKFSTLLCQKEL